MGGNRSGQVHQGVQLLELTRPHNGQQPFDRPLALFAARAEHDSPPLDGCSEGVLSDIVRRRDALVVHEGEEMLIVHEERVRHIAHVRVGRVAIPFP